MIMGYPGRTIIFYESPYRLLKTLQQIGTFFGMDRPAAVSREISKVHAETVHGTIGELVAHFTETEPKGEIVLVVGGKPEEEKKVKGNKYKSVIGGTDDDGDDNTDD